MLLDSPTSGAVGEIFEDKFDWAGERVVAVVKRDENAGFPKPNDVTGSVTSGIGDETDVFFDAPSSRVVTVVFDRGEGLNAEAVAEHNDSVLPEAHNIGKAGSRGGD